jgi:hypothetical protein
MTENRLAAPGKLQSPIFWALIVLIVGLMSRLLMVLLYQPVSYSDTPSYRRLAEAVLRGFAKYDGTRTPGYPVFMALVGNDQSVWLAQLVLGLATTLLLFYIGWKLTDKPWFGGLIGLAHTFNLGQLFFESNLLTESLTTFLLILTLTGVLAWLYHPKFRSIWLAALLGLVSTLTLLVRPLFIYIPVYTVLFLWFSFRTISRPVYPENIDDIREEEKSALVKHLPWRFIIAFMIPVVLLLGGWFNFIHSQFGDWSLTTMTGYHLIQHTGSYFEYVPDEYAILRDTYIKYRDTQIAQFGTQTNTIWEAIPELSRLSGYNFYDLSRVLAKISIQLILEHPQLFIKNALQGWWMFWRTSVYWSADAMRFPLLAGGVSVLVQIQRAVLFLVNLIFIFASIYFIVIETLSAIRRRASQASLRYYSPAQHAYFWFLTGVIWLASILQTLLDHGDNPRFLIPLQSLVVLWVALFFFLQAQNKLSSILPIGQVE